jgi:protein PhnA
MSDVPPCPNCAQENTYPDGTLNVCADCGHEWSPHSMQASDDLPEMNVIRDANGNALSDGDSVVLVKDLRQKFLNHTEGGHPRQEHSSGGR